MNENILLTLTHVSKTFPSKKSRKQSIRAVDDVSFQIERGKTLGIVGESGSGKSTIGKMIVGIETPTSGTITYHGSKKIGITMIFQDALSSLNPRKTILEILGQPLLYHHLSTKENLEKDVAHLMELVQLPKDAIYRYPHEFSGGQAQRIAIARAISLKPDLIIADEPVSALDVSIQAQILNLLKDLQKEFGFSYLFIAHGLPAVKYMADEVGVMYQGRILEYGLVDQVFNHPKHQYTKHLLSANPIASPHLRNMELHAHPKTNISSGCDFAVGCVNAKEKCACEKPELKGDVSHQVACFNAKEGD